MYYTNGFDMQVILFYLLIQARHVVEPRSCKIPFVEVDTAVIQ